MATKVPKTVPIKKKKVPKTEPCEFKGTTGNSVVSVKKKEHVKKVEKVEDCFILLFDPTDTVNFSNLSLCPVRGNKQYDKDVSILAEKGQVACRDYPHPRHLCVTHPFKKTSHDFHCKMCYCYVCDKPAPCMKWTRRPLRHCDAFDDGELWTERRRLKKMRCQFIP